MSDGEFAIWMLACALVAAGSIATTVMLWP
jgi:hypothetical protein